jgi:hypothetical protein
MRILFQIAALLSGLIVWHSGACAEDVSVSGAANSVVPSKSVVSTVIEDNHPSADSVVQFESDLRQLRSQFKRWFSGLFTETGSTDDPCLEVRKMRKQAVELKARLKELRSDTFGLSNSDRDKLELDLIAFRDHDEFCYYLFFDDDRPIVSQPNSNSTQLDESVKVGH